MTSLNPVDQEEFPINMDNDTLRIALAGALGPMFWGGIYWYLDVLRTNSKKKYEETGDPNYLHTSYYVGKKLGSIFRL